MKAILLFTLSTLFFLTSCTASKEACTIGSKRCHKNQVQSCQAGYWETTTTCEEPQSCQEETYSCKSNVESMCEHLTACQETNKDKQSMAIAPSVNSCIANYQAVDKTCIDCLQSASCSSLGNNMACQKECQNPNKYKHALNSCTENCTEDLKCLKTTELASKKFGVCTTSCQTDSDCNTLANLEMFSQYKQWKCKSNVNKDFKACIPVHFN